MTELRSAAVIGAGTMGHGIAQCCAMAGLSVAVVDTTDSFLQRGLDAMRTSLTRFVRSQKLTQAEADAAFARVRSTTSVEDAVADVDVVIEAVPEVLELKQELFGRLATLTRPGTLLGSNTTQFSITSIAAATDRPEDVIGTHFFNPPVLMKLVEVIRGLKTSDHALDLALELTRRLGKEAAVCKRDAVGFISSRALAALRMECIRIYEEGIASIEDIDKVMRLGLNHPMGQFELNDFNGLDITFHALTSLREAYGDRFAPPQSLINRIDAGMLGRKTGAGWYDYSGETPHPTG